MSSLKVNNLTRAGGSGIPDLGGVAASRLLPTAWANFDGTGVVAIRNAYNVASITDNGTGDYTANFAAASANVNYATVGSAIARSTATATGTPGKEAVFSLYASSPQTVNGVRFRTNEAGGDAQFGSAPQDASIISVIVFGGQA